MAAVAKGLDFELGLIDLGLPGMGGVELIATLRLQRPNAVLVAFTIFEDAPRVFAALRAGARGYLLKTTPPSRLVAAHAEAAAGGAPMSPSIPRVVIDAFVTSQPASAAASADAGIADAARELVISDDGGGFDATKATRPEGGVSNLRTRASALDATLEVTSSPPGTRVVIAT